MDTYLPDVTDSFWPFVALVAAEQYETIEQSDLFEEFRDIMFVASKIDVGVLVAGPVDDAHDLPRGVELRDGCFVFEDVSTLFFGAQELVHRFGEALPGQTAVIDACVVKMKALADLFSLQDLQL